MIKQYGETTMSEGGRDSHFNVNVRTGIGSRATMANNEDSFLRAMEIQERKRAKKELEKPKEIVETAPEELAETVAVLEEAPVAQEKVVEVPAEPVAVEEAPVSAEEEPPPAKAPPKPSGGGVPGPAPRSDFTAEEKAAMLKRARAHAVEAQARKK